MKSLKYKCTLMCDCTDQINVHEYINRAASNPNHFSVFPFIFILLRQSVLLTALHHLTMQSNIENAVVQAMYLAPILWPCAALNTWQQIRQYKHPVSMYNRLPKITQHLSNRAPLIGLVDTAYGQKNASEYVREKWGFFYCESPFTNTGDTYI